MNIHNHNPEDIARDMKAAQDECRSIEPFTARVPGFDTAAAYAVARRLHKMRLAEGAVPVGRKIGFTNPEMWSLYGVQEPIWAWVNDTTVVHLSGPKAECAVGAFAEPKIEPEIVVHFRSAPPVDASPADVLACIDWVAHGVEIVQSHFPGWQFQAADTIADSCLHARLLVGEPVPVAGLGADALSRLEQFRISLSCNGSERAQGRGANVLGSPVTAVAHLIDVIAGQPGVRPLQTGELVTTGTLTKALPIQAGETWTTELTGINLPGLSVTFTA